MDLYIHIAEKILLEKSFGVLIVGGAVRDALLKIPVKDIDFVITNPSQKHLEIFDAIYSHLLPHCIEDSIKITDRVDDYKNFKVSFIFCSDPKTKRTYDFTYTRAELYLTPGSKPEIREGTLLDDALRRDFSINAMASSDILISPDTVIDSVGGLIDLSSKLIRVLHEKSFEDDPIRILRVEKFRKRFSFLIDKDTESLMKDSIEKRFIRSCSLGRRYFELLKVFSEESAFDILNDLNQTSYLKDLLEISGDCALAKDFYSNKTSPLEKIQDFINFFSDKDKLFIINNLPIPKSDRRKLL